MNVSKLLRFLLSRVLVLGIVEDGGGAAADEDDADDGEGEGDGSEGGDDAGAADEGADDAAGDEAGESGADGEGSTTDELVVTIDGEEPPEAEEGEHAAPSWVRDLRKSNREKDRRIRELEAKVEAKAAQVPDTVVVGDKPKLEDHDYDSDKYEAALDAWHARKLQADEQQRKKSETEAAAKAAWQARLDTYSTAKKALKVSDFEDAEEVVKDTLSITQQGVILNGATRPELLVYAIGKNPKKAKELAAITDPVKFAFAAAKLETQLKVTPRKSAPAPERQVRSTVAGAAAVDNQLERLREQAAKTGNMSKVLAYKNAQREKKRA
jgi:hypothetical protein